MIEIPTGEISGRRSGLVGLNDKKIRVAVIGGGCAAMAAVWELSRPEHGGRYQITVFQEGWRLGGKGASGRGPNGRIEEHGLHVWLGFYDNAFRMMRECYGELADGGDHRFGDWLDAWIPENRVALISRAEGGGFEPWVGHMPPRRGLPGDPLPPGQVFSLSYYMARAFELFRALVLDTTVSDRGVMPNQAIGEAADIRGQVAYAARLAAIGTTTALAESLGVMATLLRSAPDIVLARKALPAAEAVCTGLRTWIEENWIKTNQRRFLWEVADLTLATMVGLMKDGVATDKRGLDAIDDKECRQWLLDSGASVEALQSPFLRGLYDLSMGYVAGDPNEPCLSAGQGLRGTLRTFFGYRGAFMWRMRAGMGDVVFAPLYEALCKRGVRFEFFHRLTNVGVSGGSLGGDTAHVSSLSFDLQARTRRGARYKPLIEVAGRPCWPSKPDLSQLTNSKQFETEAWDFESHWDRRWVDQRTLKVGADFDFVLLGVGLGAIPYVCKEILAREARWRDMVANVKTVASQALQLWLNEDLEALGWTRPSSIVGAFDKPFDTICEMAHVVPEEGWGAKKPKTSVYFCAVLQDPQTPPSDKDRDYPERRNKEVRAAAEDFLRNAGKALWPKAYDEKTDEFRWGLLAAEGEHARRTGSDRLDSQYWRANVNPSDRYVIHTPGSFRYRISPLDRTYDNFTIAGDWTDSGFHSGCVEGAVMSGLLAAHALSGAPNLDQIIAYDHP